LRLQSEYYQGDTLPWYAIHTRSHHEGKVECILKQRGHETFLPRITLPARRRDRKVTLNLPLFPGYLFIQSDIDPVTYLEVIRIKGVVRVLGVKDDLSPVPQEIIDSINSMIGSGRPCYPYRFLKIGTRVRILEGPLAGISGIVVHCREQKRKLVVSVELFRRAVAVELEDDAVEPYR
jgi:transcriptional antiterminator NusG